MAKPKKDLGQLLGQYQMKIYETESRDEAEKILERLLDPEAGALIPDVKVFPTASGGYCIIVTNFLQTD